MSARRSPVGNDRGAEAAALARVVEVAEHDRHLRLARDVREARLPVLDARTRPLGGNHQHQILACVEHLDHLLHQVLAQVPTNRDAAETPEERPERTAKDRVCSIMTRCAVRRPRRTRVDRRDPSSTCAEPRSARTGAASEGASSFHPVARRKARARNRRTSSPPVWCADGRRIGGRALAQAEATFGRALATPRRPSYPSRRPHRIGEAAEGSKRPCPTRPISTT